MAKCYALPGDAAPKSLGFVPAGAVSPIVWLDNGVVPDCMFGQALWLMDACAAPGLFKYASDVLMMFVGSDPDNKDSLNAEIDITLENDVLTLRNTCFVFVPAGTACGNITVRGVEKPVLFYTAHMNASDYLPVPAAATQPKGKFAGNVIEKYAPVSGKMPQAPEGFLQLLLWIDGQKLAGAPYMETVWFMTTNMTGPEDHVHDFDEIIGFIGSDPEHPEDLGAEVRFYLGGEIITIRESCLFYIPRGVHHSPILVPEMERPIYHFSGGNGGDYVKKN